MEKQNISYSLLFIMALSLMYASCQKKYSLDLGGSNTTTQITASLSGRVLDDSHLPVKNATVTSGTATTTTDINGYFRFANIIINNPDISYVKVVKEGFFTGSRTYQSNAGSSDYVAIQLIKKITVGTFSGSSGGTVIIPDDGGKIEFPANALTNTNSNAAYSGTVSAAAFFINPAGKDFQEIMPGTLRGINSDNKQVGLQSFGMIAVELTGAGGEKLQLTAGKTANLTFPIQAGLLAQAPGTIPLWSFNENTGLWLQEGIASRQGNNYVGIVSHFSFWNCDFPLPIIKFSGTYVNQNGVPLSHVKVLLKTVDDAISTSGFGYTDAEGRITGSLPAAKAFLATVYNTCGDAIDVRNLGPFVSDVTIGTLTVKTAAATAVRFTGTVANCTGGAVNSGFVDILIDNNHYLGSVTNGNFNVITSRCSSTTTTASIMAYDDANVAQSTLIQITVADTIVTTGALTACGNTVAEFLNYKLNGTSYIYSSPTDTISMSKTQNGSYTVWFGRKRSAALDEVNIMFPPATTTSTPLTSIYIQNGSAAYSLNTAANITITENGAVGGFISGNFSAVVKKDSTTSTYPVTASFRFRRSF